MPSTPLGHYWLFWGFCALRADSPLMELRGLEPLTFSLRRPGTVLRRGTKLETEFGAGPGGVESVGYDGGVKPHRCKQLSVWTCYRLPVEPCFSRQFVKGWQDGQNGAGSGLLGCGDKAGVNRALRCPPIDIALEQDKSDADSYGVTVLRAVERFELLRPALEVLLEVRILLIEQDGRNCSVTQ